MQRRFPDNGGQNDLNLRGYSAQNAKPREALILPSSEQHNYNHQYKHVDENKNRQIFSFLNEKISFIKASWPIQEPKVSVPSECIDIQGVVDQLLRVLLHQSFNHQSRGRYQSILPGIRHLLSAKVANHLPITLFFLYNGGYRAEPFPYRNGLIFKPDQTELLLLYQVSLLQKRITKFYPPGIDFVIVINNGVASWVNDIPIDKTESYVARFRKMIRAVGACGGIRLLVQSEMSGFRLHIKMPTATTPPELAPKEQSIVERFLGRPCSAEEARHRFGLYALAEAKWAEDLSPVSSSEGALLLRQVAHPGMLSFRPFPGGAIRAQNGSIGFAERDGDLIPKLVTSESFERHEIKLASISIPLLDGRSFCNPREHIDG